MAFTKSMPWIFIVFPIAHVAVGFGLTYLLLVLFLNTTDIVLSSDALTVKIYPLPWMGNRSILSTDLRSFSYRARNYSRDQRTTYDVFYVDASNRERSLVRNLLAEEQANYMAKALTRFYLPGQGS